MNRKDPIICTYPKVITLSQLEGIIEKKDEGDKAILISIIEHRLSRRFFKVLINADEKDLSSFLSLAVCCFLIETLECFYEGLRDTRKTGEGARVFNEFFKREQENFPQLEKASKDFYESVRCGLLHQGETMNGWFLQKKGPLFVKEGGIKIINGDLFLIATTKAVENYLSLLSKGKYEDEIWENAFKKLIEVCKNCKEIKEYK